MERVSDVQTLVIRLGLVLYARNRRVALKATDVFEKPRKPQSEGMQ